MSTAKRRRAHNRAVAHECSERNKAATRKHPPLYRFADANTYTDNLTLKKAREFKRLQGGGTITRMEATR